MLEFDYSANAHFAEKLTISLEQTTMISLDDRLGKVADHFNRMKTIGPAKCNPSVDKQNDRKDNKNKGDKSAVANQAISNSATSSENISSVNSLIWSLLHDSVA